MASALVQVVGMDKLLAKVDAGLNVDQTLEKLMPDILGLGAKTLVERMPADWERPRQVTESIEALTNGEEVGSLSIPRYPYVFFERGSVYPHTKGSKRQHRTRGNFVKTALRIKPRRYLARTKAIIRREIPNMVLQLQDGVEKAWSA